MHKELQRLFRGSLGTLKMVSDCISDSSMARCLNLDGSMPEDRWLDAEGLKWLDADGMCGQPRWLDVGAQLTSPLQSVAYPLP